MKRTINPIRFGLLENYTMMRHSRCVVYTRARPKVCEMQFTHDFHSFHLRLQFTPHVHSSTRPWSWSY